MDALLSGHAGVAILLDGDHLASLHVGRSGEVIPRQPAEVHLLLGGARDLEFLEGVELEEVVRRLEAAHLRIDALHLALILLDGELSVETRKGAAEELEEVFESEEVRESVERILYAHPLPATGDLAGALYCCPPAQRRAIDFLLKLQALQDSIASVKLAWEEIPGSLFGSEEARAIAHGVAIREGVFRKLVLSQAWKASSEPAPAESFSIPAVRGFENQQMILRAWMTALRKHSRNEPYPRGAFKQQEVAEGAYPEVYVRGVDGTTGRYFVHPVAIEDLIEVVRGEQSQEHLHDLRQLARAVA